MDAGFFFIYVRPSPKQKLCNAIYWEEQRRLALEIREEYEYEQEIEYSKKNKKHKPESDQSNIFFSFSSLYSFYSFFFSHSSKLDVSSSLSYSDIESSFNIFSIKELVRF